MSDNTTIAVVGLGYVGLPLALQFLGVEDEGALRLGDGVEHEGGLAGRLGAEDLDDPAAGQAAVIRLGRFVRRAAFGDPRCALLSIPISPCAS